jgi:endonuclease/exonuclease/phosphatase family metal-dependent hydrolase
VRLTFSVRRLLALTFAVALSAGVASAQTTVTVNNPSTHVDDTVIRGGTYANTVFDKQPLATKVHPTDQAYTRRTLLKFDTHNTVPAGATVQSATLTLTISKADAETRKLAVYRLSQTFKEPYATWYTRQSGYRWTTAGGDLAEKWAETSVGATVGSKVTFDVTAFVQRVVKGTYGSSRYTRIGLVDLGGGSNTSYKQFHSSESADPAVRPKLVVVYGGLASSPAPAPAPAPTTSTSTSTLKVLDWNTHYGVGTDGRYNIDRIATYIAKFNPDVVSLNEVTRYSHYNANEDQASRYAALLKAKTGRTWYYSYKTDNGASKGVGNLVLSRYPIASKSSCQLSSRRVAVNAAVYVNGRLLNVWSTHLDSSSGSSMRIAEVKALTACISSFAQQRIVAGDFNARDYTTEINMMESSYYDGWAESAGDGAAIDYPGNTAFGATRNRRIDYVWYSKSASYLRLTRAQVFDTRDSRGYMPSDHKPLMVTFVVK